MDRLLTSNWYNLFIYQLTKSLAGTKLMNQWRFFYGPYSFDPIAIALECQITVLPIVGHFTYNHICMLSCQWQIKGHCPALSKRMVEHTEKCIVRIVISLIKKNEVLLRKNDVVISCDAT